MTTHHKLDNLRDRAHMLATARIFFHQRNILEVDCPLITQAASIDAHIDLIPVKDGHGWRYLHTSPEYCMKRLIADGIGDTYQLGHVFRQGEISRKHNPEFTMAEWYRLNFSFEEIIAETLDFIRLFLGNLPQNILSYRDVLKKYAGIDYVQASNQELFDYLVAKEIIPYSGIEEEGKDALLNLILGSLIEPQLGQNELFVLAYYPSSQAALAKTCQRSDELAAERFEVYYNGIELANGYHELADAKEQRVRLKDANAFRQRLGKEVLPIDEKFLHALEKGFPDCCGVAVGFDRLMMLRRQTQAISEVIPFDWSEC